MKSAAYRPDVRKQTEQAAQWELQMHDTYLALVSGSVVREREDWSEPVQIRMEPRENGIVEIEVRRAE